MKNVLYILMGVMAGFVLAGALVFISRRPAGEPIVLQPAPTKAPIAVHVIGAVPRPGLYEFAEGARVQDAIDAAGGLLAQSSVEALNLAAPLEDGKQLVVPFADGTEVTTASEEGQVVLPSSTESEVSPPFDFSSESETPVAESNGELVNLNTATLDELNSLPGIGPTLAQRIIDYRTQNGNFSTIEDLMNVSGIGVSTFEEIKNLITV
jgi:competence protein ComEA